MAQRIGSSNHIDDDRECDGEQIGTESIYLEEPPVRRLCHFLVESSMSVTMLLFMQRPRNTAAHYRTRALLLIGVVACLCLSFGNSVALLPHAWVESGTIVLPEFGANDDAWRSYSLTNPVVTRVQTPAPSPHRGKRQPLHLTALPPNKTYDLLDGVRRQAFVADAPQVYSFCSISQPPGRAPPGLVA